MQNPQPSNEDIIQIIEELGELEETELDEVLGEFTFDLPDE